MTYRVIFFREARADIRGIATWLNGQGSRSAVDRWYAKLTKTLKPLEKLPEIHPIAEDESERFGFPVRESLFGKRPYIYRILYTVDADTVNVIAVRHAAQGPIEP